MATTTSTTAGYVPPILESERDIELTKIQNVVAMETANQAIQFQRMEEEERDRKITMISIAAAAFAMCTAGAAMFIEWSYICGLAFVVPLVTSPYSVYQRRKLNKLPTLREEHNKLRLTINRLQMENNQLTEHVDKLEKQVDKVQKVEGELKEICDAQGQSVETLQAQVRENGTIIKEIKELQETEVMQQILTAVIASDTSGNWKIDDREMDILILRLRALPSVRKTVSEEELRHRLTLSPTVNMASLYKVALDLVEEDREKLAIPDLGTGTLPEIS